LPAGQRLGLRKAISPDPAASPLDVVAAGVRLRHWKLGFKQYSFRLIARALHDDAVNVFRHLSLIGHAAFPSGFPL
jgi:hypothetical protein